MNRMDANIPIVLTSPRKVNEFQRLLDVIEDPAKGHSKSLPWQRLWKIRQEAIEDIRDLLKRYSALTICSFHTDSEGEVDCISFMLIRPHLKIFGEKADILTDLLGYRVCWTCARNILTAEDQSVELQRLIYLSKVGQMYPPEVNFSDPSRVFLPYGAVGAKSYSEDTLDTDADDNTLQSMGREVSTPTTNSVSVEILNIDALLREESPSKILMEKEADSEPYWKEMWDIQ